MLPVPIYDGSVKDVLPDANLELVKGIKHYIVENVRTARRCLKRMVPSIEISTLQFYELNSHTRPEEITGFLEPLRNGEPVGLMSEAGCPGVADPGASVVRIAQAEGLNVVPMVGPSSIVLSLMASGLNGQCFAFNGYIPVENDKRDKTLRELEIRSRKNGETEIFIETPYRNAKMMESLLKVLNGETLLCVASNITAPDEKIITRKVKDWRNKGFDLSKVPTIFLFNSGI